jgi:putative effector of murein hydrolase
MTLSLCLMTICAYAVARRLFVRSGQHPLLHPVFVSVAVLIPVLLVAGRSFDDYLPASNLLTWPLGPATVALALPVYKQRAALRTALVPLVCGVVAGSLATIATVLVVGALGGLATPILGALALKSVTAAIAVELARLQGADPGLTAIFVVVTGTIGAMIGPGLLTKLRITDPVARGVALGTISHAQGTAAALHEREISGALGTLSFVGAALLTSLIAPLYIPLLLHLLGR